MDFLRTASAARAIGESLLICTLACSALFFAVRPTSLFALAPALLLGMAWCSLRFAFRRRQLQPPPAEVRVTRPPPLPRARTNSPGTGLALRPNPVKPVLDEVQRAPAPKRVLYHVRGGRWSADERVLTAGAITQLQRFRDALLVDVDAGCKLVRVGSSLVGNREKAESAAQLAFMLAERPGVNVLLVEADLDKPGLHEALDLRAPRGHGFSEQLERMARSRALRPVTRMRLADRLDALLESDDGNPAQFDTPELGAVLEREREDYQFIVLNGPIIGDWPDPLSLQRLELSFVFVRKTPDVEDSSALRAASEQFRHAASLAVIQIDPRDGL